MELLLLAIKESVLIHKLKRSTYWLSMKSQEDLRIQQLELQQNGHFAKIGEEEVP